MATEPQDLTLATPNGKFTFRVGYLAFDDDKILLQYAEGYDFWFMTGGRVAFGHHTAETVLREVEEELSIKIDSCELAGFVENFFHFDGEDCHEICTFYRVQLPKGFVPPKVEANGDPITLAWHKIEDLPNIDIKPSFLKHEIAKFKNGFHHQVHSDLG